MTITKKQTNIIVCIIGIFGLVYGTAIITRLIFGHFLLDGGFFDFHYALLAFLCAVPFVIYLLFSKTHVARVTEVFIASGTVFTILFVYAHLLLTISKTEPSEVFVTRYLITFPLVVLLLVVLFHILQSKNIMWREIK